jgi:hypothetical protein
MRPAAQPATRRRQPRFRGAEAMRVRVAAEREFERMRRILERGATRVEIEEAARQLHQPLGDAQEALWG